MDFLGGQRKNVTHLDANDGSVTKGYRKITNETRLLLQEELADDVALLEQSMGWKFPWNNWAPSPPSVIINNDTTWITGIPQPLPNIILPPPKRRKHSIATHKSPTTHVPINHDSPMRTSAANQRPHTKAAHHKTQAPHVDSAKTLQSTHKTFYHQVNHIVVPHQNHQKMAAKH